MTHSETMVCHSLQRNDFIYQMLLLDYPLKIIILYYWASLVAQRVKRLPTMRETQVQSLGREDLLEKGMATHSSILPRPKKKAEIY